MGEETTSHSSSEPDTVVAVTLRDDIHKAGGLHSRAGLAVRWGVSKAYVSEVTKRSDFPTPTTWVDGRAVWTGSEADNWRMTPRKPGRVPTKTGVQ